MSTLFSSLGFNRSKHVIFYPNNRGYGAARVLLEFLGHKDKHV
ncbi:MAG: hypothetical protein ACRECH_07170 [Nitrososphaerales archaeon]